MSIILFDFDGVLADTLNDLLQFGQEACNELGIKHTVTARDLNVLEVMSFATYGRQLGVPEQLVDEFVSRCLGKIAAKKFPPAIFPGLANVVRELSTSHVLGIVTTNSKQNVQAFLSEHGLQGCFQVIYGVDSPGTKAEKISRAQSQFSGQHEAVFMVGDSVSDIRAAREAGALSVAVGWGHQSLERLVMAKPDAIIHQPSELRAVINKRIIR